MKVPIELLVRAERELSLSRVQVEGHVKVVVCAAASALGTDLVLDAEKRLCELLRLRANLYMRRGIPVVKSMVETDLFLGRWRHRLLGKRRAIPWRKDSSSRKFSGLEIVLHCF